MASTNSETTRQPRTLIVSWHWPPMNRASAGVLGALFSSAPEGVFRVITRSVVKSTDNDRRPASCDLDFRVPPTYVRWPFEDSYQPTFRAWPALVRAVLGMIRCSYAVDREWGVERVLAVYPHRFSLLTGMLVARKLGVPLVLYMHDLCAEALTFRNPLRLWFWRTVDRLALGKAWLVLVPTEEFAAHYRQRGIHRCWVLPHCATVETEPRPPGSDPQHERPQGWSTSSEVGDANPQGIERPGNSSTPRLEPWATHPSRDRQRAVLHLLYSGQVYDPHLDAARAFIEATRYLEDVRVTFHSNSNGCNGFMSEVGARWLPFKEAMAALGTADALVVLLGSNTPCPEEVMGCFPSKLVDYLSVGRPVLAVVPKGCFVDRLVSQTGCGIAVHSLDASSIRAGVERLRHPRRRAEMAQNARRLVGQLAGDVWMARLLERLRDGPALESSCPPFPQGVPHGFSRGVLESPVPQPVAPLG